MNGWLLCAEARPLKLGSGSPCVERRGKWWHMRWVLAVKRPVAAYGKPFLLPIVADSGTPIFGRPIRRCFGEEQHMAVGKETGETAHVERWNNTLRQRLARFVRKTLSFSKSLFMHDACLSLFLHRYNLERAAILM